MSAQPVQINPLSFYEESGAIAARAWRRSDAALAVATRERARRGWSREADEYRASAQRAYDNAYRAENGLPPLTDMGRAAVVAAEQAQGIQQRANGGAEGRADA